MTHQWQRVTRARRCPICDKPDFCTTCPDLGLILCMRVESDRPSKNKLGGWLHQMNGATRQQTVRVRHEPPIINVPKMLEEIALTSLPVRVESLAKDLGVAVSALISIGCLWSTQHRAWAIPEHDGAGWPIGICLRYQDGKKLQVPGSHRGLILPIKQTSNRLFVCEGASDVAAGLTLELSTIGRPSCSGGVAMILDYLKRNRFERVVIVPDMDEPGLMGAQTLQEHLPLPSCILPLPCKDLRCFLNSGGTSELLQSIIDSLVWYQPNQQQNSHTQKPT